MRTVVALAVVGVASMALSAKPAPVLIDVPPALAGYRAWAPLMDEPQPVPMSLWIRCAIVTQTEWAEARKRHGPHTERYIKVYGNPRAADGILRGSGGVLPYGAIIAKEKLPVSPNAAPDGIGFMIRHRPPEFAATDGWEFVYLPPSGDKRETHEACAGCHRNAPAGTYYFGRYPAKK